MLKIKIEKGELRDEDVNYWLKHIKKWVVERKKEKEEQHLHQMIERKYVSQAIKKIILLIKLLFIILFCIVCYFNFEISKKHINSVFNDDHDLQSNFKWTLKFNFRTYWTQVFQK